MIRYLITALILAFALPAAALEELQSSRALTTTCANVNLRFYPHQAMPQSWNGCEVTNGHDAPATGPIRVWGFSCQNHGQYDDPSPGGMINAYRQTPGSGQTARQLLLVWSGDDTRIVPNTGTSRNYRYFLPQPVRMDVGDWVEFALAPSLSSSAKVCFMYWSPIP